MESLTPLMRKFDFPQSVVEAIKIVHLQCEKMSLSPSSALSQELNQVTVFVDDFVFGNPKSQSVKLNYIQQLQVMQALIDHFNSDADFNLLCTVFQVIFLTKGRDVDLKLDTLSKLMSLNLSQGHTTMLNCVALWWTQQSQENQLCTQVAKNLVNDYLMLLPDQDTLLPDTPHQSPLLAGILLTHFAELYKVEKKANSFRVPPVQLVRLATCWLENNKELCGGDRKCESQTVVSMLGQSPLPGLLTWTILAPLAASQQHHLLYSQLHLSLLLNISNANVEFCFPSGFLSNVTEYLLSTFNSSTYSEAAIAKTLERYGQALQAGLSAGVRVDEDLLLLLDQLPYNRLVQIVTSNIR